MVLGKPEGNVERVDVVLHPGDDILADIFAQPELEVDDAVIVVEIDARIGLDPHALDQVPEALGADGDAGLLVSLLDVHQLDQAEERHHHLLGQRQAGGVVQRHVAAVGDDAVDELHLARLRRHRLVAFFEELLDRFTMGLDLLVEDVVLGDGNDAEAPAGAAEVLRIGVDADRVARQMPKQRLEARNEGAVDVVRQHDQVGALLVDEVDKALDRIRIHRHGGRVAGVDQEQRLHLGVLQRLDVFVGELEPVLLLGADVDGLEIVVLQLRHFEIGREDRRSERDRVAGVKQAGVLQCLEDVAHGGGAAFDRVKVELCLRSVAGAHRPHQVFVGDDLVVVQRPIGNRIVVADDRVRELVHEGVRIEAEGGDGVVDGVGKRLCRRDAFILFVPVGRVLQQLLRPLFEPRVGAVLRRHAGHTGLRVVIGALGFRQRKLAEQEEGFASACRRPVRVAAAGIEESLGGFL
ncbi:hypothetical protein ASE71_28685 [Ensifer sp. Root954]|nr:hypothetical protein ASE71_28685 [Ensifer sp. Root954]